MQIPRPDQPTQTLTGPWMDLLTLVPVFLHRSGLTYQELLDLLDTAFVQIDAVAVGEVLHIAATGDSSPSATSTSSRSRTSTTRPRAGRRCIE